MSKILVFTVPVEGHFNPYAPIIEKLVQNGHVVHCFAGRKFHSRVEKIGASFLPTLLKYDSSIREPYEVFPELKDKKGIAQLKLYLKLIMFGSIPDIIGLMKDKINDFQPDLIISDTFIIAGSWIKEFFDIPNVRICVLPLALPEKYLAPFGLGILPANSMVSRLKINFLHWIIKLLIAKDLRKYSEKIRREVGLPATSMSFIEKEFENADLYLHMAIPDFEYPHKKLPPELHFIGPSSTPKNKKYKEPAWWPEMEKDIPVVLINQGTVATDYNNLIVPAIEALKSENIIIVALPVKNGAIPNLPANVYTEQYIPFGNLLPHIDLMITNGGFGATQNALAYGIPLIVAGATEDKMEVAARLEYSGAGINLRKQKPKPKNILKAYKNILSDKSYKQKAKVFQQKYSKFDAPKRAVSLIEELIELNKLSSK